MGLEISWYLRFNRGDTLEVLVKQDAVNQVWNAKLMEPQWELAVEDQENGVARALFTRKNGS